MKACSLRKVDQEKGAACEHGLMMLRVHWRFLNNVGISSRRRLGRKSLGSDLDSLDSRQVCRLLLPAEDPEPIASSQTPHKNGVV